MTSFSPRTIVVETGDNYTVAWTFIVLPSTRGDARGFVVRRKSSG